MHLGKAGGIISSVGCIGVSAEPIILTTWLTGLHESHVPASAFPTSGGRASPMPSTFSVATNLVRGVMQGLKKLNQK